MRRVASLALPAFLASAVGTLPLQASIWRAIRVLQILLWKLSKIAGVHLTGPHLQGNFLATSRLGTGRAF